MKLSENIAFALHQKWRESQLNEKGCYVACWKPIQDKNFIGKFNGQSLPKYIRIVGPNEYEIDIANAFYNQLPTEYKQEYKATGEVVQHILKESENFALFEIGGMMHDAWLERNMWARDTELDVPYNSLSNEEKTKYLFEYKIGSIMNNAQKLDKHFDSIDKLIEFFKMVNSQGENVAVEFNGKMYYSYFDNEDTCYAKFYGASKEEVFVKNHLYEQEDRVRASIAQAKMSEWINRGYSLMYPERYASWNNTVESIVASGNNGRDISLALSLMERLDKGETVENLVEQLRKENIEDMNSIMNIVAAYSKRGPAMFKAYYQNMLTPDVVECLDNIEKSNTMLAQKYMEVESAL